MARNQLSGKQIRDESLETQDIMNGTILLENLSFKVIDAINNGGSPEPGGTEIIDPFHHYTDKYVAETTTSNQWQTYLSLTTNSLADGDYRIMASYTYNINRSRADAEFRFILDGTDIISLQVLRERSADQELILTSDFANRRLQGVHTVELQYRASRNNRIDVAIHEGKLELRRVTK